MTVVQKITEWLKEIGAEGLCFDECGCSIDDICPCSNNCLECEPAKKISKEEALKQGYCFEDDCDYIFVPLSEPIEHTSCQGCRYVMEEDEAACSRCGSNYSLWTDGGNQ